MCIERKHRRRRHLDLGVGYLCQHALGNGHIDEANERSIHLKRVCHDQNRFLALHRVHDNAGHSLFLADHLHEDFAARYIILYSRRNAFAFTIGLNKADNSVEV